MKKDAPSVRKAQAIAALLQGQQIEQNGSGLLSELVKLSTERVIQELLEAEQTEYLGRARYAPSEAALPEYRNGYEHRTLKTAEGLLAVDVPQVRGGDTPYRSEIFRNVSSRSEALETLVTEMYVRGLSVRDIEQALIASTGAFVLSDTTVSTITERLHAQYEAFRTRDLSGIDIAYMFIDALYEPLRRHGSSLAVLCAWCITTQGRRMLLHLQTGNGESTETAMDFLRNMVRRGLHCPLTVTTDGAPGLIAAVDQMWPKTWRVRCWFHKMQNLRGKIPAEAWAELHAQLCDIRDAPTRDIAMQRVKTFTQTHQYAYPEACRCLLDDTDALLNHLNVPHRHRQMVRTTNLLERSFVECRRRTKTIPHLWEERHVTKLVFAVLIGVSEKWSKRLFNDLEMQTLQNLRKERGLDHINVETPPKPKQSRRSAGHVAA